MGREVRRVTANWEHPKKDNGNHKPLLGYSFSKTLKDWKEELEQWNKGFRKSWNDENPWKPKEKDELEMTFEEWSGSEPQIEDYMPDWKEEEMTHIQMYEDTSEGTPISPVFDNAEDLITQVHLEVVLQHTNNGYQLLKEDGLQVQLWTATG